MGHELSRHPERKSKIDYPAPGHPERLLREPCRRATGCRV